MSISTVTSESLQLKLRQLLPSQQGFGTDLSASDTIIPIIDLTAAAAGSDVSESLQTALSFGSQTDFNVNNSSSTIANSPGFYRVIGVAVAQNTNSGVANAAFFTLTDGATSKFIWNLTCGSSNQANTAIAVSESFDFTVFLSAGESMTVQSSNAAAFSKGSIRQVADANGTLVQPVGFTPQ